MKPPKMAAWNLVLRAVLEIGALVGLGAAAWALSTGAMRWVAVIAVSIVTATLWGVFNVLDDPSRSGKAPVEVAGWIRLLLELAILGAGAVALGIAAGALLGVVFALLVVTHYATSWNRVLWLIDT